MPPTRILLGLTGSVAAVKVGEICQEILRQAPNLGAPVELGILPTQRAKQFANEFSSYGVVYNDEDEWRSWSAIGDDVLHIELRKKYEIFIIAPLSANTLAKIANGLCDNLLTSVARAWDFSAKPPAKPFVVFPAMNTCMWAHPVTAKHILALEDLGIAVFHPIEKRLACGDIGVGGLCEPSFIASTVWKLLNEARLKSAMIEIRAILFD